MSKVIDNAAGEDGKDIEEVLGCQEEVLKEILEEQRELIEEASEEDNEIDNSHTNPATAPKKYNRKKKMRQRKRKMRRQQEMNDNYEAPHFHIHHPTTQSSDFLPEDGLKADISGVIMARDGEVINHVLGKEYEANDWNMNSTTAPKKYKYVKVSRRKRERIEVLEGEDEIDNLNTNLLATPKEPIKLSKRARARDRKARVAKEGGENAQVPLFQIRRPTMSNSAFIPRGDFKADIVRVRAERRRNSSNKDAVMLWMGEVPTESAMQSNLIHLPSEEFMHNEGDVFYKREFPLIPNKTFNQNPPSGIEATDDYRGGDIYEIANNSLGKMEIKDNDEQLVATSREVLKQGMESGAPDFDQPQTRNGDGLSEAFIQEERMKGLEHGRAEYQEETEMVGMDASSAETLGRVTRMENIEWGRSLNILRKPLHRL